MSLLEIQDLNVEVEHDRRRLLRDVSLRVDRGEILGLVGESGSGKTMLSLAVSGLLGPGVVLRWGSVRIDGRELLAGNGPARRTPVTSA